MAAKITVRGLDALLAKAKREQRALFVWDDGFGCRVSPTGKATWLVQKWFENADTKAQRIRLGSYPSMTIDEARSHADALRNKANSSKKDFAAQKLEAAQALRLQQEVPTFEAAVARYLDHKRNEYRPSYWREVQRKFHNEVFEVIPSSTQLTDVTEADLRKIINAKRDAGHHVAARYLYVVLRPFFKWCIDEGYLSVSPLAGIKCPKPTKDRERILSDDEIKAFWSATDGLVVSYGQYGPFYKLLLLTAQRREEVGGMRWDEIKDGLWSIPGERTKNKKAHTVHLSPQVLAILDGLPKRGDFVFSVKGHDGEASISGYSKAKKRLDGLMGASEWRVHDLRRTAASGMARIGHQPYIVDRVLNHISDAERGMVRVYQRHKYLEERKAALMAWGNYVERLVSDAPSKNNVIPLRATN